MAFNPYIFDRPDENNGNSIDLASKIADFLKRRQEAKIAPEMNDALLKQVQSRSLLDAISSQLMPAKLENEILSQNLKQKEFDTKMRYPGFGMGGDTGKAAAHIMYEDMLAEELKKSTINKGEDGQPIKTKKAEMLESAIKYLDEQSDTLSQTRQAKTNYLNALSKTLPWRSVDRKTQEEILGRLRSLGFSDPELKKRVINEGEDPSNLFAERGVDPTKSYYDIVPSFGPGVTAKNRVDTTKFALGEIDYMAPIISKGMGPVMGHSIFGYPIGLISKEINSVADSFFSKKKDGSVGINDSAIDKTISDTEKRLKDQKANDREIIDAYKAIMLSPYYASMSARVTGATHIGSELIDEVMNKMMINAKNSKILARPELAQKAFDEVNRDKINSAFYGMKNLSKPILYNVQNPYSEYSQNTSADETTAASLLGENEGDSEEIEEVVFPDGSVRRYPKSIAESVRRDLEGGD